MVEEGRFRTDLFYRLSIFPISVPPLRDRVEDILPLAEHFLRTLGPKFGKRLGGFTQEAEGRLLGYSWPGNVRELRNVMERAMILESGERLQAESLILGSVGSGLPEAAPGPGAADSTVRVQPLAEMEQQLVARAMELAGGNQTKAADLLEITRDQLRYRLKKYKLREGS
jgi:DNA-binding NtrC family response regulator